jgi:hypothetical protein
MAPAVLVECLTIAEETLQQLAKDQGKEVATHFYGQEINAETYAICKTDLLLKGEATALARKVRRGPVGAEERPPTPRQYDRKSLKEIWEGVSDRGRAVRSRGDGPPTRVAPKHRR